MSDIGKTIERVRESAKWEIGYCPPNFKTIQSDALAIIAELETANKRIAELEKELSETKRNPNPLSGHFLGGDYEQ